MTNSFHNAHSKAKVPPRNFSDSHAERSQHDERETSGGSVSFMSQQALNRALREAVDFVHAEGWDAPPTLFALVPTHQIIAAVGDYGDLDDMNSPLALVVQEELPNHIMPASEELGDYISRLTWPDTVVGAVLAQEIMFKDIAAPADSPARPARLFSGVLRNDIQMTLLQLRPTEEELDANVFAQDDITLLGGEGIAPGVIATLRYSLSGDAYRDAPIDD